MSFPSKAETRKVSALLSGKLGEELAQGEYGDKDQGGNAI
jgi:hypothetical protein